MTGAKEEAARLAEMREAFALFIDSSRGAGDVIPASSLGTAIRSLGYNPTQAELSEMCAKAGGDDADVSFSDFATMIARCADSRLDEADVLDAFKVLDADGSGFLDKGELRKVLTTRGEPLNEEEVEEFFALVDADGDGRIDYQELAKKLMSA